MKHCDRCGEQHSDKKTQTICDTCLNTNEVANAKYRQGLRQYERKLGYEFGYKDGREFRWFVIAFSVIAGIGIGIALTTWF